MCKCVWDVSMVVDKFLENSLLQSQRGCLVSTIYPHHDLCCSPPLNGEGSAKEVKAFCLHNVITESLFGIHLLERVAGPHGRTQKSLCGSGTVMHTNDRSVAL